MLCEGIFSLTFPSSIYGVVRVVLVPRLSVMERSVEDSDRDRTPPPMECVIHVSSVCVYTGVPIPRFHPCEVLKCVFGSDGIVFS